MLSAAGRRRRQGRDEAQALLELWTTLTDQHNSADAVGCVADAHSRRTRRQPDSVDGQDHALALVATVTRFKELRRIERAIEHRDEAELRWAAEYCLWRLRSARTKRGESRWRNLEKQIREALGENQ